MYGDFNDQRAEDGNNTNFTSDFPHTGKSSLSITYPPGSCRIGPVPHKGRVYYEGTNQNRHGFAERVRVYAKKIVSHESFPRGKTKGKGRLRRTALSPPPPCFSTEYFSSVDHSYIESRSHSSPSFVEMPVAGDSKSVRTWGHVSGLSAI